MVKPPYGAGMASPARAPDATDPGGTFRRFHIGILFQQLARDFERRARATLRERGHTGLQPSHQVVFASLGPDGARLTDLASRAGMTKQAMGQLVDDLEALGYVERIPDPCDGRAKIVRLTAKKRAIARAGRSSIIPSRPSPPIPPVDSSWTTT